MDILSYLGIRTGCALWILKHRAWATHGAQPVGAIKGSQCNVLSRALSTACQSFRLSTRYCIGVPTTKDSRNFRPCKDVSTLVRFLVETQRLEYLSALHDAVIPEFLQDRVRLVYVYVVNVEVNSDGIALQL